MAVTEALPPVKTCPACGESVRWVHTKSGKRVRVSAHPTADGRVELLAHGVLWTAEVKRQRQAVDARAQGRELHSLHLHPPPSLPGAGG